MTTSDGDEYICIDDYIKLYY